MSTGLEVPDLLDHLLTMYQEQDPGVAGQPLEPTALSTLHESLATLPERLAATLAIQHFLDFAREYLHDHPPQQHFMLAQGFGVELGGGIRVSLAQPQVDIPAGSLEFGGDIPVTEPRSIRGQHGIEPSAAVAVTGDTTDMTVRYPK